MSESDTDRRDFWWLDDVTSLAVVILLFTLAVAVIAVAVYVVVTGAVDLSSSVNVVGTIDVSLIVYGSLVLVAYGLRVVLSDIYGEKDVSDASENFTNTLQDAQSMRNGRDAVNSASDGGDDGGD